MEHIERYGNWVVEKDFLENGVSIYTIRHRWIKNGVAQALTELEAKKIAKCLDENAA